MTIGNRITTLRKNLKLSQEEMADKIGVSRQAVSKWETDASAPDAFNLIALSKLLNTTVEYIVTGKINSENKSPNTQEISTLKTLSVLGYILAIGGIIMTLIGMFLDSTWCIIGAFIVVAGFICALIKNKKGFIIAFFIMAILIVIVILLLTL